MLVFPEGEVEDWSEGVVVEDWFEGIVSVGKVGSVVEVELVVEVGSVGEVELEVVEFDCSDGFW